jgi:gluconate kinase
LLHGERDLLKQRLDERTHRYMPSSLLDSQPETLEQPETDECALSLDIAETPADLVRTIERELARLGITRPPDQAAGVSER